MLNSSVPNQGAEREKEFMEELRIVFTRFCKKTATTDLQNWGGWWRNRFRANPAKAERVLAEVRSMVAERRITRSPGAAGHDLWKRLP